MPHLVWVRLVLFQGPIGRGGYHEVHTRIRDKRKIAGISADQSMCSLAGGPGERKTWEVDTYLLHRLGRTEDLEPFRLNLKTAKFSAAHQLPTMQIVNSSGGNAASATGRVRPQSRGFDPLLPAAGCRLKSRAQQLF